MKIYYSYKTATLIKVWVLLLILFAAVPAFSQNSKGDRPSSNRENRFKTPVRKGSQYKRTSNKKRIQPRKKSAANNQSVSARQRTPRGKERAGRPVRPIFSKSKPRNKQKPWKGDISGRRLRTKDVSSNKNNVFPQSGKYARKTVPDKQRAWKGNASGNRVVVRSRSGKTENVYPQYGKLTNNPSIKPRNRPQAVSNRSQLARLSRMQSDPNGSPPGRKRKVVPRSASRSFIARRSINVYAHFPRQKRKSENAWTKDLAGRPLRARNYETPRPGIIAPGFKPYYSKKRVGDRPYHGPSGSYKTASRPGEIAWTGDIAKRRIRHRDRTSKKSIEGTPILSQGYKTRTGRINTELSPLPPRRPVTGGLIGGFPGKIKRFQHSPGFADQGEEFGGAIKTRRPFKGGGSVSGKLWNNDGKAIAVKTPIQGVRVGSYQGNIKTKRPLRGGGSVSGKLWNNKETPIPTKTPPPAARRAGEYPGNIKMFELNPGFSDQGEEFTGYIKLKRKSYVQNDNAVDESVKKKRPGKSVFETGELQVKVKQYNYKRNPSSTEEALKVREPGKVFARATDYQGNIKMQKFSLFEKRKGLHPDAKFVKINKNNVDEERDMMTNLKLWWARFFKKEETQPDHLKDKGKKPRYDKDEQGLWYE